MIQGMRRSGIALAALLAVLGFVAGGCGGGGGSANNTTQKGTPHYDPTKTILHQVGLQVCHEQQISGAVFDEPGFTGARVFTVAPDCKKAPAVPTTVSAATYATHETVAKGAAEIKKKEPKAEVFTYRTLVVAVVGPNAKKYSAELEKIVKPPS